MSIRSLIEKERFIALARHVPLADIAGLVKALEDGGIRLLEITFDPCDPDTLRTTQKAIKTAVSAGMATGAGTVLSVEAVEAACDAGAQFIVSPNTDEQVMARTKELGRLSIPGAFTPTEIVKAHQMGADIVKVFPVLPHQLDYVKVLTGPLPHIPIMVTGGVNPGNAADFINAGATAVAAGATIVSPAALRARDWRQITERARAHVDAIREGTQHAG